MSNEGVRRTAPATPGMLNTLSKFASAIFAACNEPIGVSLQQGAWGDCQ